MRTALLLVSMLVGATVCLGAEVQVYPTKPVRLIVPSGPGGTTDLVARAIAQQLAKQLANTFVVDNRPGASGTIAYSAAARSTPDGYTLVQVEPQFSTSPAFYKTLSYDPTKDFTPITQILRVPEVLVVHLSVKANTLKEFIALAQASPGKLNYGSGGVGSAIQLFSELFKKEAKVNITHIPYSGGGGGAALPGLLSDQIQMMFNTTPPVLPLIKSGRLRALAITTDGKRSPLLPDVPSMSEAGIPGMAIYIWHGMAGPANMPKAVVHKLNAEVIKAMAVPSVKEFFLAQDAELVGGAPEEFSKLIRDELRRWTDVIKSADIRLE